VPAAPTQAPAPDPRLVDGARRAVARHGWEGASLQRVAEAAGLSRMTLHRRGITKDVLLRWLAESLEAEHREAMWPALTATGNARDRLAAALGAQCEVAENNLELLEALGSRAHDAVYHEEERPALTRDVFIEPLRRLLIDGAADGSLKESDPAETATVLLNLVGWTYRHLRTGHGWEPDRARRAVLAIALEGVAS
jgi:AcrR family transcriptional regulator